MARRRKKKRNGWKALAIVLTVVLVLGIGIFFTKDYVVAKAEEKVQDALIENVLETVIASDTSGVAADAAELAKQIYDGMSEADKETCRELIENNLTAENVKNVTAYVKSGDLSGLKSYVKSSVSQADKEAIKEMYYKYRDQL